MEKLSEVKQENGVATLDEAREVKERLHSAINSVIENFRHTKNFQLFCVKLDDLRSTFDEEQEKYLFDRSWSNDQIKEVLDLIELSSSDSEKGTSGEFLPWALSTERKYADDISPTVSDFVIQSLIDRVHQNRPVSRSLEELLSTWAQNIQMADADLVNKLFLAAKNNHGVIGSHFLNEARASIAFYGKDTIDRAIAAVFDHAASRSAGLIKGYITRDFLF